MAEVTEITVKQQADTTAFFGSYPDALKGIDEQASYTKFEVLLADALRKSYPDADVSVEVGDVPDRIEVNGSRDDQDVPAVEDILHEVWESWDWVVEIG